jgi:hypothetical protein
VSSSPISHKSRIPVRWVLQVSSRPILSDNRNSKADPN